MTPRRKLMTKNALAIEYLAKDFISRDIGSKILTISEYEKMIDVARGTIQNAIKQLVDTGAIAVESRGQLGTYLSHKDLKLLLEFAGISFLVGVMPLPYSRTYEGLSTALLTTMENTLNIPVNMAYMRGAQQRIEMMLNGRYDFAIMSKYAALAFLKHDTSIEIIKEFSDRSYLSGHIILFSKDSYRDIEDGMRIGIDHDSIDQSSFVREICAGKHVEFVEIKYNQLIESIQNGVIDATVWNEEDRAIELNALNTIPLNLKNNDNRIAVVVINRNRKELGAVMNALISVDVVTQIQQDIINGTLIPSY